MLPGYTTVFSIKVAHHIKQKEKKERNLFTPTKSYNNKLLIGVSECDYIRKMLNKKHMGKVLGKAAKR